MLIFRSHAALIGARDLRMEGHLLRRIRGIGDEHVAEDVPPQRGLRFFSFFFRDFEFPLDNGGKNLF